MRERNTEAPDLDEESNNDTIKKQKELFFTRQRDKEWEGDNCLSLLSIIFVYV